MKDIIGLLECNGIKYPSCPPAVNVRNAYNENPNSDTKKVKPPIPANHKSIKFQSFMFKNTFNMKDSPFAMRDYLLLARYHARYKST